MPTHDRPNSTIDVYVEVGQKRVFACALDWPGWCRLGKTEDSALDALAAYAGRYAAVAQEAGISFLEIRRDDFRITERTAGSTGYTDFGVPGAIPASDREPLSGEEAERHLALLRAAWTVFDRIAAATPVSLRKGPRGGGRDRDQVIEHVLGAETAYARKFGVKHRQPARGDAVAITALREDIIAALRRLCSDSTSSDSTAWPPRYAIRRIAWHVLDHAWEMQDRSEPAS